MPTARPSSPIAYRPDLDGLRAVAVLAIILSHAGVPFLEGGYLGVDVFFVLSGYLISAIILRDLQDGQFSFARFYERRARRILPALVLVVAWCVPPALWLLLPDFRQNFGQSVVATLLMSNNLLLALTSGYWELESAFKPLLHTWSLGVEEQFYLGFPLLMALAWKRSRRAALCAVIALLLASFLLSEYGWRYHPVENFYLPFTRAWQLMAGCALAFVPRRARTVDGCLGIVSLLLVTVPMVLFDESVPSPSIFAALPVLGAAGLIRFNREGGAAYRLLSLKPAVFVGLVSYSAYLWHQPLFAFARVASLTPPSPTLMAGLSVATLFLAVLTWHFVEQPFRARGRISLRRFVPLMLVPMAVLVGIGLTLHFARGFPAWDYPDQPDAAATYISYNERIRDFETRRFAGDSRPRVLLLGDSYARDVGNVLLEAGVLDGKTLVYREAYPLGEIAAIAPLLVEADVVVIGLDGHGLEPVREMERQVAALSDAPLVFFGSKDFGENINPLRRLPEEDRSAVLVRPTQSIVATSARLRAELPPESYVDLIDVLGPDGRRVRVFDENGNPLTPDRWHLTLPGAKFVARRLLERRSPGLHAIAEAGR